MASRDGDDVPEIPRGGDQNNRRRHRCQRCPASFDTGQKLGGHMRKHCLKQIFRNGRRQVLGADSRKRRQVNVNPRPQFNQRAVANSAPPPQQALLQDVNSNRQMQENNLSLVPYRQHDVVNSRQPQVQRDVSLRQQQHEASSSRRFGFGSFLSIDSMLQHEMNSSRQHQDEVNSRQHQDEVNSRQQQIEANSRLRQHEVNSIQQQQQEVNSRQQQHEVNSSRRVGIGRFLSALSKIEHKVNSRKHQDEVDSRQWQDELNSRKPQDEVIINSRQQQDIEVIDSSRHRSELGRFLSLSLINPLMDSAIEEEMLRWKEEREKREEEERNKMDDDDVEEDKNRMDDVDDDDDVEEGEIAKDDRRDVGNNKATCFRRPFGNSKNRDPNFYTFL